MDGSYTLRNVGLGTFATASVGPWFLLRSHSLSHIPSTYPKPAEAVLTGREGTSFSIESAGNGEFVVRLATLSGWLLKF